jgi:hypothetical protein
MKLAAGVLESFARAEKYLEADKRVTISLIPVTIRSMRQSLCEDIERLTAMSDDDATQIMEAAATEAQCKASRIVLEGTKNLYRDFQQRWGETDDNLKDISEIISIAEALDPRTKDLVDQPAVWTLVQRKAADICMSDYGRSAKRREGKSTFNAETEQKEGTSNKRAAHLSSSSSKQSGVSYEGGCSAAENHILEEVDSDTAKHNSSNKKQRNHRQRSKTT